MSHGELRKENDCLNCGTEVQGPYCHKCGQENIVPHETFWNMVKHFFYDITHFDGSFFSTLKVLIFKPGFLSKEYIKGKRKTYLHPIRMYVFTSAVFFLVFFSLFNVKELDVEVITDNSELKMAAELKKAKTKEDSLMIFKAKEFIGLNDSLNKKAKTDSSTKVIGKLGSDSFKISIGGTDNYNSVKAYDSVQKALPVKERDDWLLKLIYRKVVGINEKYKGRESKLMADIANKFLHSFPYLLFVSLPLYALFLKLIYLRRKQFYYADHGIFLIHLYIFTFLFMLLFFGLDKLENKIGWSGIGTAKTILILTGLFYTLKAIRNFYQQRWSKTITKFILFNFLCLITAIILFVIFLLFSFYQI